MSENSSTDPPITTVALKPVRKLPKGMANADTTIDTSKPKPKTRVKTRTIDDTYTSSDTTTIMPVFKISEYDRIHDKL